MKVFLVLFGNGGDAYVKEVTYTTYQERYEATKDIPLSRIFETADAALKKVDQLNSI